MRIKFSDILGILIISFILIAWLFSCASCSSSKDIHKDTNKVEDTRLQEKSDSIRILKTDNERLTSENIQLRYFGVDYDTVYVKGDTIKNTITIHDGDISVSGRIKSAHFTESAFNKNTQSKSKTVDSSGKNTIREITYLKTVTITKTKHTQISFLNWILFIVIGVVIGVIICNYKKIQSWIISHSVRL